MRRSSSAGRPAAGGRAPAATRRRRRAARLRGHAGAAVRLHTEQTRRVRGLPTSLPLLLRRPARRHPRAPPWAHNSLGASVHTALKNWYALPADRRRPEALATLLKGTWVREGYRDDEQERAAYRRALGWLEAYVETLEPDSDPLGVERVVAVKTAVLAFNGRADRIDSRPGPEGPELVIVDYKTGRTGLDTDDARGSQALALYAYARRAGVPSAVPPGGAAPPADRHGRRPRPHRRVAGPATDPRGRDGPRHHGRRAGGRRRRRRGRGFPGGTRPALWLVRLPAALPDGRAGARARNHGRPWTGPPTADRPCRGRRVSRPTRRQRDARPAPWLPESTAPPGSDGARRRTRAAARARSGPPTARWSVDPDRRTSGAPTPAAARTRCRRSPGTPSVAGPRLSPNRAGRLSFHGSGGAVRKIAVSAASRVIRSSGRTALVVVRDLGGGARDGGRVQADQSGGRGAARCNSRPPRRRSAAARPVGPC